MRLWRVPLPTPLGTFVAVFSEHGLAQLEFPGRRPPSRAAARPCPAPRLPAAQRRWAGLTARALARALQGRAPGRLPPLDESGTAFQRAVWRALRDIPPGVTRTYAEVTRLVGRSAGAARAVGQACGANPIPVLTPCHRVVAAGGRLGGFSGGLAWKRRLLALEGTGSEPARLTGR
jgi:AraC family transcriptional regulator of adaptative response/methylated-DNA-[protein]-cysteine methyltransferase